MKIALVEDRIGRMQQFLDFDIIAIEILQVITEKDLSDLKIDLDQKTTERLDSFDCLICHRSALTNAQRESIKNYCKTKNKPLVFFSGGISSSFYNDTSFPYLNINSSDLYSDNLKMFSESAAQSETINLLILQFGANWKTNLLLLLKENLNLQYQRKAIIRTRNLQIPKWLVNDFNLEWLKQGDLLEIGEDEIKQFKYVLDTLIYESL